MLDRAAGLLATGYAIVVPAEPAISSGLEPTGTSSEPRSIPCEIVRTDRYYLETPPVGGPLASHNAPVHREWTITDSDGGAVSTSSRTAHDLLGDLFVVWLHDRGDVSEWDDAPRLAAIVHAYSDLSLPVVAVWLGIEPSAVWDVAVPTSAPPWTLHGPTGGTMVIDRTVTPVDED